MFFRLSFVTLIFAVIALSTPVKRGAAQVELDIQNMGAQSSTLDQSIQAFPNSGGTLTQVYAIYQAGVNLENLLKTAANDASASPVFTDAQANAILKDLKKHVKPNVKKALRNLVDKKPAATALDTDAMLKSGLQDLQDATDAFRKELLPKTPADQQSNVQEQLSIIDAAFSSTINAYSS